MLLRCLIDLHSDIISGTITVGLQPSSPTPSSSIQEPESMGQVGPDIKLSGLSPHKLVIEQEREPEIMNLKRGALSEREAENAKSKFTKQIQK